MACGPEDDNMKEECEKSGGRFDVFSGGKFCMCPPFEDEIVVEGLY